MFLFQIVSKYANRIVKKNIVFIYLHQYSVKSVFFSFLFLILSRFFLSFNAFKNFRSYLVYHSYSEVLISHYKISYYIYKHRTLNRFSLLLTEVWSPIIIYIRTLTFLILFRYQYESVFYHSIVLFHVLNFI